MSLFSLASPVEAAAFAGSAMTVARPLLGLGLLAALLVAFKPLLLGLLRAAMLVVKPRRSMEELAERSRVKSILMVNRMARDVEAIQPSLAAELRSLAQRG